MSALAAAEADDASSSSDDQSDFFPTIASGELVCETDSSDDEDDEALVSQEAAAAASAAVPVQALAPATRASWQPTSSAEGSSATAAMPSESSAQQYLYRPRDASSAHDKQQQQEQVPGDSTPATPPPSEWETLAAIEAQLHAAPTWVGYAMTAPASSIATAIAAAAPSATASATPATATATSSATDTEHDPALLLLLERLLALAQSSRRACVALRMAGVLPPLVALVRNGGARRPRRVRRTPPLVVLSALRLLAACAVDPLCAEEIGWVGGHAATLRILDDADSGGNDNGNGNGNGIGNGEEGKEGAAAAGSAAEEEAKKDTNTRRLVTKAAESLLVACTSGAPLVSFPTLPKPGFLVDDEERRSRLPLTFTFGRSGTQSGAKEEKGEGASGGGRGDDLDRYAAKCANCGRTARVHGDPFTTRSLYHSFQELEGSAEVPVRGSLPLPWRFETPYVMATSVPQ